MEQPTQNHPQQTLPAAEREEASPRTTLSRPVRNKQRGSSLAVAAVFVIVGYLLASQLESVETNSLAAAANSLRLETLQELYNQETGKTESLEQQLLQLQQDLERYRTAASEGSAQGEALRAEVEQLELLAGLTEVSGPGVSVILSDSTAVNTSGDEADYLIHDSDLLTVVNELRSAGAEAVSLNGERLLATSEIRCTGAVVTVNGRQYAAPYVIFAIGDANTLYNALTMRNGVVDVLGQWKIKVQINASEELTIPQYRGTIEHQYARPADQLGEEEGVG
ncbi:MAG: DUF881 domain-containing protein [Oscillospiraceae bacterium]|nr:DUF881 domain-containing protein [Oscillospiraceae bacterium]